MARSQLPCLTILARPLLPCLPCQAKMERQDRGVTIYLMFMVFKLRAIALVGGCNVFKVLPTCRGFPMMAYIAGRLYALL